MPIEVNGTGVLLPVGKINQVRAQVRGAARWMFAEQQYNWIPEVRKFQRQPDQLSDMAVLELSRRILRAYYTPQLASSLQSNAVISDDKLFPQGTLLICCSLFRARVTSGPGEYSGFGWASQTAQQKNLIQKQSILEKELTSRKNFLNSMLSCRSRICQ